MKNPVFIVFAAILSASITCADELSDIKTEISYRTKILERKQKAVAELRAEVAELDQQIANQTEASDAPKSLSAQAADLEAELKGKVAFLNALKASFLEKVVFTNGEELGDFQDVKGNKYSRAVVKDASPRGIVINHATGIARLTSNDFPDGFRPGLLKRPETPELSFQVDDIISERPSSIWKSAAFAEHRRQKVLSRPTVSEEERDRLREQRWKEREESIAAFKAKKENKIIASLDNADEIRNHNRQIDLSIKRLQARLDAAKKELAEVETSFKGDVAAYATQRTNSATAKRKERNRRADIVNDYEDDKVRLDELIGNLEREIREMQRKKKSELGLPDTPAHTGALAYEEKRAKIAKIRIQLNSMEETLQKTRIKLADLEDERAKKIREYNRSKVKGDRNSFEKTVETFNREIARHEALVEAMEKKIRETESSILDQ